MLKEKTLFTYFFVVFLFTFFCLSLISPNRLWADTYLDDSNDALEFGGGTHSDTQWDVGNSWVELDATGQTNGVATFTSRIINAESNARWDTLSWVPQRPTGKELPDNGAIETGYAEGNMDMSNTTALFHFNESTGASSFADSSGNGNTASCVNCPVVTTSGKFGRAFTFDGNDDAITLPSQPLGSLIGATFTIAFWVNPGAVTDVPTFGFTNSMGTNALNPVASYSGGVNIGSGGSSQVLPAFSAATANRWTHYALVDNGTHYIRYVDGYQVGSTAINTHPGSEANRSFVIGQTGFDGGFEEPFGGAFDDFVVMNRGLSAAEILNMYKRGAVSHKFQIRSCNDNACAGESFVGPDGTAGSFYTESTTSTIGVPQKTVTNLVRNQYFQYLTVFETASSTLSPELKSVSIQNTGAGVPGVTLAQSGGTTALVEGGATDSYTIVLDAQTIEDTVITLSSGSSCTVSTSSIAFTSDNWDDSVTVTVTAVNDNIAMGNHTCTITHTAASEDSDYDEIAVESVLASITDNDSAGVTITESGGSVAITEGGATDTYTVVLTSAPTSTVTVAVNPDAQSSVSTSSIVFTSDNWDDAVTVTVTAVNDAVAEGSHGSTITHSVVSDNWNYNGIGVASATADITDNDSAGVTITESGGTTILTEAGATDTFTIVLTSAPTSTVAITITGDADASVSTSSIDFHSTNWDDAVTVTITAVDDAVIEGAHTATVSFSVDSDNWNYDNFVVAAVTADITDNDAAPPGGGGGGGDQEDSSRVGVPALPSVLSLTPAPSTDILVPESTIIQLEPSNPVTVQVRGVPHSITQSGRATAKRVTVIIRSKPVRVVLLKGKTKRVDIDGDKKSDVSLLYVGLKQNKPEIKITPLVVTPPPQTPPVLLNGGASVTDARQITISLSVPEAAFLALSENKEFRSASFVPYTSSTIWNLSPGYGDKTVYVRFRSASGATLDASSSIRYVDKVGKSHSKVNQPVFQFTSFLSQGSTGQEVRELQKILQQLHFIDVAPTGFFGAATRLGLMTFQKAHGIDSFGYVGPATRATLNKLYLSL